MAGTSNLLATVDALIEQHTGKRPNYGQRIIDQSRNPDETSIVIRLSSYLYLETNTNRQEEKLLEKFQGTEVPQEILAAAALAVKGYKIKSHRSRWMRKIKTNVLAKAAVSATYEYWVKDGWVKGKKSLLTELQRN